jgi:FkbM family methyltransferase
MLKALHRFDGHAPLPDKAALGIDDAATQAWLRRRWEERAPYHAWLSVWRHFAGWEGTFLDVGANIGQTITSFALFNPRMRIWSFEPNPLCAESIAFAAGLVPNEVEVFVCGLADEDAALTLHVPVVRGTSGFSPTSNATLRRGELDKPHVVQRLLGKETDRAALTVVEVPAVVRRPESLPEPEALRLVKIDVEGFERKVLDGLTPLLRRQRPVLTVERNNWPEIAAWMDREGYAAFDYLPESAALRRVPEGPRGGSVVDPLLLPLDRLAETLAAADGLRLEE